MIKLGTNATKLLTQDLKRCPINFDFEEVEYHNGWCLSLATTWNEELFNELNNYWKNFYLAAADQDVQGITFGFSPDLTCKVMLDNGKKVFFAEDIRFRFINSNKVCAKWLSDLSTIAVLREINVIITFNK